MPVKEIYQTCSRSRVVLYKILRNAQEVNIIGSPRTPPPPQSILPAPPTCTACIVEDFPSLALIYHKLKPVIILGWCTWHAYQVKKNCSATIYFSNQYKSRLIYVGSHGISRCCGVVAIDVALQMGGGGGQMYCQASCIPRRQH